MKSYPTYEALAIDLDLHFFDKISVLKHIGNKCVDDNGGWFVITDDGHCHLFDKDGNLDDINKLHILKEKYVRKDVKKIIIPESVISIESWAFWGYHYLTSITISDSVTSIGAYAFFGCCNLKSVAILNGVTNIEWHAFRGCENLKSIFFKGKTIEQVKAMHGYPWGIDDENIIKVS